KKITTVGYISKSSYRTLLSVISFSTKAFAVATLSSALTVILLLLV
ncbi:MAG: hypothetical protein ACI90V_010811, partial [Bacillariaceae sp.]